MRILYAPVGRTDLFLVQALEQSNHQVEIADEEDAHGFAAILLDGPAPDPARAARAAAAWPGAFLIVLCDRDRPESRLATLRAGADACFARPLHSREILEKLEAMVRRSRPAAGGSVVLEPNGQSAIVGGVRVGLSRREQALLALLLRRPGAVFSIEEIIEGAWPPGDEPAAAAVRTALARLGRKLATTLGRNPIAGERGRGYRIVVD
jgi:DNA-binding response OmpR family regulator